MLHRYTTQKVLHKFQKIQKKSHTQKLKIVSDSTTSKILQIPIPLPSQGTQFFSLKNDKNGLSSLLYKIQLEDPSVKKVDVLTLDGCRIARATSPSVLLKNDFLIRVNEDVFYVERPVQMKFGSGEDGVKDERVRLLVEFIEKKRHEQDSILFSEFSSYCEDIGIVKEDVQMYLNGLVNQKMVVHIQSSASENEKLYLQPQVINNLIAKKLNLEELSMSQVERKALLTKLQKELTMHLDKLRLIEGRAYVFTKYTLTAGLAFVIAQFTFFGRLTWYDLGWDVMEPYTYFTTVVEVILGGYLYYMYSNSEFSNESIKGAFFSWRVKRIAKRSGLDLSRIVILQKQIRGLKKDIEHYQ